MKTRYISFCVYLSIATVLCISAASQNQILIDQRKVTLVNRNIGLYPGFDETVLYLDAKVTDENGNPVSGLNANDFTIYQDNQKKQILSLREIRRAEAGGDPRTIMFIIDDIGLSREKFSQVKTALKNFADKIMQPNDMVGLARTAGGGFIFQPVTGSREMLRSAIERWQWSPTAGGAGQKFRAVTTYNSSFVSSCSANT
jgi:VWFA-related protein